MDATFRRRWIAIDIETLVGSVLLVGLLCSVALIASGLSWCYLRTGTFRLDYLLPATDVGTFIVGDIRQAVPLATGLRRPVDLGIGDLMMAPYVRVLASSSTS